MSAEEPQTASKRPFGVYVIIALLILNILANTTDVVRVQLGLSAVVLPQIQDARVLAILSILIAIVLLVIILGLWRCQYWAWFATMIVTGIALSSGIWLYWNGGRPYASLLINSLVVLYLNQREVRQAFEEQHARKV